MEDDIAVSYCKVVAISAEPAFLVSEYKTSLGAHFPFLCDSDHTVQEQLDLLEYTDTHHDRPYIPTTFILEPCLKIYKIYNGYWFWGRPTNEDIRQDFRAISMRIRPDWDLQAPGVRDAYEEAIRTLGRRPTSVEFSRLIQAKRGQVK
ncbi:MAG: redoxin domain-containing protein [Chloroflexi bacterium]|nr:redoxin domain-containing protein [Chloroflexota bacterium]